MPRRSAARPARRIYGDDVREALVLVWEASDRVCGKRLKPLIPILVEAMERHGHLKLAPEVGVRLLSMSAATIDRALREVREKAGRTRRRPAASSIIRRSIPIRTFSDWRDPPPGFVEADLVAHSGPSTRGSFVQTLVLTDVATGWTECAPLLVREQRLLSEVLTELRKLLPFDLLGFDTDNDSVFMNETVRDYCQEAGIEFTRCRPYRKNDQAFVEQKNGAVVRRIVGYRRLEGLPAAAALARLYRTVRLFVNFFQPSFKLSGKERDGARVRKRYHAPATPCQRVLADRRTPEEVRRRLKCLQAALDPVQLLSEMRMAQQHLVDIADSSSVTFEVSAPSIEEFLAGLRTAWKDGEVRPTARPKPAQKRGRRRPDPFAQVTGQLRSWFEAEPWRTGRELLERLQTEYPDAYADHLLRTLQRRLKIWRGEMAHTLVFGLSHDVGAGLCENEPGLSRITPQVPLRQLKDYRRARVYQGQALRAPAKEAAVLDSRCARRQRVCADRGGRMLAARIEPKNVVTASEVRRSRGTFPMRQTTSAQEHSLNEAIRVLTQIVAL